MIAEATKRPRRRRQVSNPPALVATLVTENMRLAQWYANKYAKTIDHDHAFSLAMQGLQKAAETWNEKRGRFGTIASMRIRQKLNQYFHWMRRTKRGGEHVRHTHTSIDDKQEGDFALHDTIPDQNGQNPHDALSNAEQLDWIMAFLHTLPDKQRDILMMRFGLGSFTRHTLEETGKVFGLTRERIRQIEGVALDSLRDQLRRTNDPRLRAHLTELHAMS